MRLKTIEHSTNLVLGLASGGRVVIEIISKRPIDFGEDFGRLRYKIGDNITGGRFRPMYGADYMRNGSYESHIRKYLHRHGFEAVSLQREIQYFYVRDDLNRDGYLSFTQKAGEQQVLRSCVIPDLDFVEEQYIDLNLRDHTAVTQAALGYWKEGVRCSALR